MDCVWYSSKRDRKVNTQGTSNWIWSDRWERKVRILILNLKQSKGISILKDLYDRVAPLDKRRKMIACKQHLQASKPGYFASDRVQYSSVASLRQEKELRRATKRGKLILTEEQRVPHQPRYLTRRAPTSILCVGLRSILNHRRVTKTRKRIYKDAIRVSLYKEQYWRASQYKIHRVERSRSTRYKILNLNLKQSKGTA